MLKKMDTSSGSLNFRDLELSREVENQSSKKCYRSIIPSRKQMYNVPKKLHFVGDNIIPFIIEGTESGEAIQFDEKNATTIV